jgi:hypothetical protein
MRFTREGAPGELNWIERLLLLGGIFEIPLGIEKYFAYSVKDAELGAVAGFNVSIAMFCFVALYAIWVFRCSSTSAPFVSVGWQPRTGC